MAEEKPLTKSELLLALRESGFATKNDVGSAVREEIEQRDLATKLDVDNTIHERMTEFYEGLIKPQFDELRQIVIDGFSRVEARLTGVEREIDGLKAELADTPSRGEFEQLKGRVDRLERTN